ncbi:MAG: hypothetical protein D3903_08225 [Candidatus Electrothrix sp. GM3_4]|nr:hypothetical protein [Candidatus Electrothrix sp. GM3_4]
MKNKQQKDISIAQNEVHGENQLTTQEEHFSKNEYIDADIPESDLKKEYDRFMAPENIKNLLQKAIDEIISNCEDVDWNEDYLSLQVVSVIRSILGSYILPNIEYQSFDIEAYKLTGKAEETHGDIAIVVSRSFYERGPVVSGVGFYEAKASSLQRHDHYPAFSFNQLRRLVSNTPKLSYLLYNKSPALSDSQEWPGERPKTPSYSQEKLTSSCARAVDANLLKQYKKLDEAAHFRGQAFGYHFVQKILSGRDLDYSRPPIETIRRWLKVTRRTSALVVSVAVREDKAKPAQAQLPLPSFEKILLRASESSALFPQLIMNVAPPSGSPKGANTLPIS